MKLIKIIIIIIIKIIEMKKHTKCKSKIGYLKKETLYHLLHFLFIVGKLL